MNQELEVNDNTHVRLYDDQLVITSHGQDAIFTIPEAYKLYEWLDENLPMPKGFVP